MTILIFIHPFVEIVSIFVIKTGSGCIPLLFKKCRKYGKMSQTTVDKFLKKYVTRCHMRCSDVPLSLHAHQFRHAKAFHWLEDGINIVQISFLLGHENIQTTMIYMDITTEQVAEALATLEDEKDRTLSPKWKKADGSLVDFCWLKV